MQSKRKSTALLKGICCAVLLFITLFPIYWLISMAVRPTDEMSGHISLIPGSVTMEHFTRLFAEKGFGQAIMNSMQTTGFSLIASLMIGICAAYIIARRRFNFGLKRPLTYWVLLVRVLPPVAFTIPLYTMFSKAGLLNGKLPVVLACVLINVPLIIWFLISFFRDLPEEIEESAKVDGASEWQLFVRIVLPLVAPGIAAVAMLSFMYAWNEYTYTVIFTRSPANYTVPLALSVLNTEDSLTVKKPQKCCTAGEQRKFSLPITPRSLSMMERISTPARSRPEAWLGAPDGGIRPLQVILRNGKMQISLSLCSMPQHLFP